MHQLIMSRSSATFLVCGLELRIGLGVGVGRVGVAHVAGDADGAAEGLGVVEVLVALVDPLLLFALPEHLVAGRELRGLAGLARPREPAWAGVGASVAASAVQDAQRTSPWVFRQICIMSAATFCASAGASSWPGLSPGTVSVLSPSQSETVTSLSAGGRGRVAAQRSRRGRSTARGAAARSRSRRRSVRHVASS